MFSVQSSVASLLARESYPTQVPVKPWSHCRRGGERKHFNPLVFLLVASRYADTCTGNLCFIESVTGLNVSNMFCFCSDYINDAPITVAAGSKAWTLFARSNAGIVGSNRTQGMDVCVRLFCVCVVLCVGSGLATGWSPVQVLPTVYGLRNWKSGQGPTKGCSAMDR
jgi:hypothetical protein